MSNIRAKEKLNRRRRIYYLLAAVIFALLASWFYFFDKKQPLIPQQIYANYFSEETLLPSTQYYKEVPTSGWENALKYYFEEDYNMSAATFDDLLTNPLFDHVTEAYLYNGISYMKMGFHETALENLSQLNTNDPLFGMDILWFTALTHLRAGDAVSATTSFKDFIARSKDKKRISLARKALRMLK